MRRGRVPSVTRYRKLCRALGLEFYVGQPRDDAPARHPVPRLITKALNLPEDATVKAAVTSIEAPCTPDAFQATLRDATRAAAALVEYVATADKLAPPGESVLKDSVRRVSLRYAPAVRHAAGSGELVFDESDEMRIEVAADALPSWARPERITCTRVIGDSMLPDIRDGDLVAIECGHTTPRAGSVFSVLTNDGLVVKRLRRMSGRWHLISDNPAYEPRPVTGDDRILGQVAWTGPPTADAMLAKGRRGAT